MLYPIVYLIFWVYFKIFNFWSVEGKENIPEGAAIFAANHTAWSDPVFLALGVGLKYRLKFMTKIEVIKSNIFGKLLAGAMKSVGMFFVDRKNSSLAAIKYSLKALKEGEKLVIFPEGTRVKDGEQVDAKGGTVMLAYKTGAPVVPVYITAGHKLIFTKVRIIIGKPIYYRFEGRPASEDYDRGTETLMSTIFALGKQA